MPLAARVLGRTVKFVEDRREHFVSSAHERGQVHHVEVGFDDDGRLLGLDVEFWHDHGAYTPYGLIVPIITSTQLLGPYKPRSYRVVFESPVHQHGDGHALPRRGPAAGLLRDGADHGRDRGVPRQGPHRGARGQLHPARRVPLRPGADLPGRPRAGVRLRRLPGVAGQAQGAGRLGRVPGVPRRDGRPRAGGSASGWPATSRAPGSGPTRAPTCTSRPPARSRSPPASPPRARATRPSSRSWWPTSSAAASRTSRWSPATPGGCRTPWARSPRAPR